MPRCGICAGCWFYRREIDPASPEYEILRECCHGDYLDCVRYQFAQALGIDYLPRWLDPGDYNTIEESTGTLIR
jgi:hypothetical protein